MSDWKYEIDEVGPEAEADSEIEPGSPRIENVIPFLLGAGLAIALLVLSL
ncbi:MAG: DUF7312 domain-containing protein [Halodesulfurarchaeum sp.]